MRIVFALMLPVLATLFLVSCGPKPAGIPVEPDPIPSVSFDVTGKKIVFEHDVFQPEEVDENVLRAGSQILIKLLEK